MTIQREVEIDELGLWVPKSGFFQHEYRKKRARLMVQQAPQEHGARLAFCTYCQSAYLASDAVPNSACHDSPPALMYDLEDLVSAAGFVEALVGALDIDTPELLLSCIEILAGLVRDRVAGAADKPSQEPSTASGPAPPSESEQVGTVSPDASVEGPTTPTAEAAQLSEPDQASEGEPSATAPSAPQTQPRRRRAAAPAVPA